MAQRMSEIVAVCVGLVGLIGAAATTGLPMWKVTAFIGENIIVMETRWEGLWMNCYRQANIRMQCKVYDSLLFLPPDLQAARGLMCCSLALSGLGLLLSLAGLSCISCFRGNERVKTFILMAAGGMQFMACVCVIIPVSWTGHVIIRDFYNPLLIDAQRRELGEALYIGWVTSAFLFASGLLFVCRRVSSDTGSFDMYGNMYGYNGYKDPLSKPTLMRYNPVSSVPSMRAHPALERTSTGRHHPGPSLQNVPVTQNGVMRSALMYNPGLVENGQMVYNASLGQHPSSHSSNLIGSLSTSGNTIYASQPTTAYSYGPTNNPSASYLSAFQAVPQNPVFVGYKQSIVQPQSHSGSHAGAARSSEQPLFMAPEDQVLSPGLGQGLD